MIDKQESLFYEIYIRTYQFYIEEIQSYPWQHFLYRQHIKKERL